MKTGMIRLVVVVTFAAGAGCTGAGRMAGKVGLLEQQVSDLQKSNRRINERIDELQIQVSMLTKKLSARRPGSGAPVLGVIKVRPEPAKVAVPPARPAPPPAARYRGRIREVDPDLVDERLPVDHQAARQPLLGRSGPDADSEPGEYAEEADPVQEFHQAAAWFNLSRYQEALPALQRFVRQNPEHPFVTEALYLIGRSKLAIGEKKEAQGDFIVLAQKYPKSERAAGALLMAGQIQEKLGWPREARSTYLQLVEGYPLTGEAAEANRRLRAMR